MPAEVERLDLPVLVSANALFDHSKGRFREVPMNLQNLDVALDSAGFVAMSRYKSYPWSVRQYVELVVAHGGFSWWAQMDCCCEPELAADKVAVRARVRNTAKLLGACRSELHRILDHAPEFSDVAIEPMPVLQGWRPEEYVESAALADEVLRGQWPALIGIGSVCRRPLTGPASLWRVLTVLDQHLPPQVKLHLFGVKGAALSHLTAHPRVVSVDSMAYEFRARMAARLQKCAKTVAFRVECLEQWVGAQRNRYQAGAAQQRFRFA
jgi:hypothetical protein